MPSRLRSAFASDSLNAADSPRALNVRFIFGEVRQGPGRGLISGPSIAESILSLSRFPLNDGSEWILKLTQTKAFRWGEGTPGAPRQFHEILGSGITGSLRRWSTAAAEGRFFFSRGLDQIQRWPAGSDAPINIANRPYEVIPASAGTVPRARFVEYFNDRLVAFSTTEGGVTYAQRARWAANGDHTNWDDTAGLGAGFLELFEGDEEPILGVKALGKEGMVYKRSSISALVPTGQLSPTFQEDARVRGVGCSAPFTIANTGQRHFFLGNDKRVYQWDGIKIDIVSGDIEEELKGIVDPAMMDSYFGAVCTIRGEYWLVIGDNVFGYDYVRSTWWRESLASLTALAEVDDSLNVTTWNTIQGNWPSQNLSWADLRATRLTALWGGRSDGSVMYIDDSIVLDYFAQGNVTDRFVETLDFYLGYDEATGQIDTWQQGTISRVLFIYKYVNAEPFEFGVSFDQGQTWMTQQITPNMSGFSFIDVQKTGNIARFRMRENNATGQFRWRSYEYELIPAGPLIPAA